MLVFRFLIYEDKTVLIKDKCNQICIKKTKICGDCHETCLQFFNDLTFENLLLVWNTSEATVNCIFLYRTYTKALKRLLCVSIEFKVKTVKSKIVVMSLLSF